MGVPADPVRRRAVETSRDARNRSRPVHLVLPAFILSVLDRNLSRAIRRSSCTARLWLRNKVMDSRVPIRLPTRDVVRLLAIIFRFYILLRLLWIAHPVVFLFFLGVLFGLPLAQGADWLEKRNLPRWLGVTIILTVFLGLLIGGGASMAPILRTQSRELQQRLPEAMDKIDAWLGHRANGVLGILFNEESADTLRSAAAQRAALPVDSTRALASSDSVPFSALTDSSRADTLAVTAPGMLVKNTTTRTEEVSAVGNVRPEINRQVPGPLHSVLRVLHLLFA